MKEILTKNSLDQSIELISELNLNEEDYEKIFEKVKVILKNPEIKERFDIISEISGIDNSIDIKTIMKKFSSKISLNDLNFLLKKIVENEELIDFIQDLFLEKLI
ncbi:MAG: hypothetical protein ACFFAN_21455 [Promethearchaeota archaeon]